MPYKLIDYLTKEKQLSRREFDKSIVELCLIATGLEFLLGLGCSKKEPKPSTPQNYQHKKDHLEDYLNNLTDEDP